MNKKSENSFYSAQLTLDLICTSNMAKNEIWLHVLEHPLALKHVTCRR